MPESRLRQGSVDRDPHKPRPNKAVEATAISSQFGCGVQPAAASPNTFCKNMNLRCLAVLAVILGPPHHLFAEEEIISGHLEYHPSGKGFTLAAFNWGKLYYDADGKKKVPIKLTREQLAKIQELGIFLLSLRQF